MTWWKEENEAKQFRFPSTIASFFFPASSPSLFLQDNPRMRETKRDYRCLMRLSLSSLFSLSFLNQRIRLTQQRQNDMNLKEESGRLCFPSNAVEYVTFFHVVPCSLWIKFKWHQKDNQYWVVIEWLKKHKAVQFVCFSIRIGISVGRGVSETDILDTSPALIRIRFQTNCCLLPYNEMRNREMK